MSSEVHRQEQQRLLLVQSVEDRFNDLENQIGETIKDHTLKIENQTLKIRDLEAALAISPPQHITSAANNNHTADHEDNPSLTPGVVTTSATAGGGNYSDIQNRVGDL